jgi:spore coat protein H
LACRFLLNEVKQMRVGLLAATFTLLCFPVVGPAAEPKPKNDPSAKVFGLDKVWSMHLKLTADQWEKMQPQQRGGFGFMGGPRFGPPQPGQQPQRPGQPPQPGQQPQPTGQSPQPVQPPQAGQRPQAPERPRQPQPPDDAKRRNLFGMSFSYVKGEVEIDSQTFKDVGVRYKGNARYASSQGTLKRPFKIDLERYNNGQTFFGLKKLTLNTDGMDPWTAREVLSYGVYRSLGVPAPRTAFVKLTISVPGKYDKEFAGLYVLVESIDKTFLKDRFGSSKGLLLKPERVGPLEYLGDEWTAYENRYEPKTAADGKSKRRLMEFVKLVQKADDKTFQQEIGKYLDVDEFLRFLAGTVALSSMDSFIGLTHNYFLYLDPKTNKFSFIPWDFDHSFGGFPMGGTPEDLAELSIRKPYSNNNRLIERLLSDEKMFAVYKGHLRKLLEHGFTKEGIRADFDAIQKLVEPIKKKEKEAVAARHEDGGRGSFGGGFGGMFRGSMDPAAFTAKRVASLQAQLDGKSKGKELRGGFGRPGGFGMGQFLARPVLDAADKDKDGKLSKDEMNEAVKSLFAKVDKDRKGELNQEKLTEGINQLMPRPPGFGGPGGGFRRPGGGPPAGGPGAVPGGPPPGGPGAGPGGPPPGGPGGGPGTPPPGGPGGPPPGAPGGGPVGPPPGGPGGRGMFGPPGGMGGMFAQTIVKEAGKDGKVNLERLLAAAAKRFTEADKNHDGKLDERELTEALNALMPPFGPPGGPGGRPGGPFGPPGGPGGPFGPPGGPGGPPAPPAPEKEKQREGK